MSLEAFEHVMARERPSCWTQLATGIEGLRIHIYLLRQGEPSPEPGPARAAGAGASTLLAGQVGVGSPEQHMPQTRSVAQRRHLPGPIIPDPARNGFRWDVLLAYLGVAVALVATLLAIRVARRR